MGSLSGEMVMGAGLKLIGWGVLCCVLGVGLLSAGKSAELEWYHPLPAFAAAAFFFFLGVMAIRNANKPKQDDNGPRVPPV
jgi:hypothetical protein